MTAAEVLQARGEAIGVVKGRAEGKAEGRAEGKAEGKAEVVLRLLRLRFGEVPEAVRARLQGAASEELDVFADGVIAASSLDEVCARGERVTAGASHR